MARSERRSGGGSAGGGAGRRFGGGLDREGRLVDQWLRRRGLLSGDERVEGRVLGRLAYLEQDGIQPIGHTERTRRRPLTTSRFTELGWLVRTSRVAAIIGPDSARSVWWDLTQLWRADRLDDGSLAVTFSNPLLVHAHWAPATDDEGAALTGFVPGLHQRADLLRSELDLDARTRSTAWQAALAARGDLDWSPGATPPAPTVAHVEDGLDDSVWILVLQGLHACRRHDGPAIRSLTRAWADQNRFALALATQYVLILLGRVVFTDLGLREDRASEEELVRRSRSLFVELTEADERTLRTTLGMILRGRGELPYDLLALAPFALLAALVDDPVAALAPLRAWLAEQVRASPEHRTLVGQAAAARAEAGAG